MPGIHFSVLQQRRYRWDGAIGPRQPRFCRSAGACGHHEIGILLPARQRPLGATAAQVLPSCLQCRRGEGGSARYSADPASPRWLATGNRALGANRDRASARCRDLQCPGRRSLCRRAKRAGLSADHGQRYAVFTKAADAFLQTVKSSHKSDRMPSGSPV